MNAIDSNQWKLAILHYKGNDPNPSLEPPEQASSVTQKGCIMTVVNGLVFEWVDVWTSLGICQKWGQIHENVFQGKYR